MRVWKGIEPQNVFSFFEDICSIPHGSGNTRAISDYLVDFAGKRGLEHYQDSMGNVILIKEASPGYEEHPPVMLQGHMDMVAVKKPDCDIDMMREGLRLRVEGDRVFAEGTSLGGDDGIAVAYGLALMDGTDYRHPRIELVLTVDEEVGMDGAREIDLSVCRARQLINLDSEEEGFFLAGCAGGARVNFSGAYPLTEQQGSLCRIKVSGLLGGHSGAEIHKERANANLLLGRILCRLREVAEFSILSLQGGLADNAIPREALAEVLFSGRTEAELQKPLERLLDEINGELQRELAEKDAGVLVEAQLLSKTRAQAMTAEDSHRLAALLNAIPSGVQAMSKAMEGLVETSLNLGVLRCEGGRLKAGISVRSSQESAKRALIGRLESLAYLSGVQTEVTGDYPGWAYRKDSPLRDKMSRIFQEMYGKKPEIQAIHAGLECGLLADKLPGLDCVSLGPDMKNIHTTEEELSISSVKRVWEFLVKLLEEL